MLLFRSCATCCVLTKSLEAKITRAFAKANTLAVSKPIPCTAPVTIISYPVKSFPLTTSEAGVFLLNFGLLALSLN